MTENTFWIVTLVLLAVSVALLLLLVFRQQRVGQREQEQARQFTQINDNLRQSREAQLASLTDIQVKLEQRFGELQQGIEKRLGEVSRQNIEQASKSSEKLQEVLHKRLHEISGQVETRLNKGFEKTTETFTDVIKRLALIDEAQKKITELSSNVVSLQEVLSDKRSRGAFGEVQMADQVRNMLPENSFELQYSLKSGTRVDCMLFLPDPMGNLAIDSKFPLDSYKRMADHNSNEADRQTAERQFRQDIKKHIKDIADKYIVSGETADSALMFIPAEAVFAEIHAHQPELVEASHRARVWMVSPSTLMAMLTTVRAVLKDAATRQQVHLIQEHLALLSKDFGRFQERMNKLSVHIRQAHEDVDQVSTSAKKITNRFVKIEKVELDELDDVELLETDITQDQQNEQEDDAEIEKDHA